MRCLQLLPLPAWLRKSARQLVAKLPHLRLLTIAADTCTAAGEWELARELVAQMQDAEWEVPFLEARCRSHADASTSEPASSGAADGVPALADVLEACR